MKVTGENEEKDSTQDSHSFQQAENKIKKNPEKESSQEDGDLTVLVRWNPMDWIISSRAVGQWCQKLYNNQRER